MNVKKSRILYVKRFLEQQTDEDHPATMADILAYLADEGIPASRTSVTQDIEQLVESGVDAVCNKSNPNTYFIGDGHFELPELKLLIDAVQASRFIPRKKAAALTGKLTALASVHHAGELSRQLYVSGRDTPGGEKIYHTIDLLHRAIASGRTVTFKYYEYDRNKRKRYKHDGKVYRFSPYGLVWNSDRYYTVGYSGIHGKIITFRVDRIAVPELTGTSAQPKPDGFDMAYYAETVFQMYDGPVCEVTLKCENALMKAVIDRFGEDVHTEILDDAHFTVHAEIPVGPTFFGWVFTSRGAVEILSPEDAAGAYRSHLLDSLENAGRAGVHSG
jgi:predicted DNA-binding transcriptional regulator YafY